MYPFQPSVDIKTVLSRLMDRLSNYAASSAEVSNLKVYISVNLWCLNVDFGLWNFLKFIYLYNCQKFNVAGFT